MKYFQKAYATFTHYIPRGSTVLAATTMGSYIMGLLRDRILAQSFGASTSLDSYNAAFLLPDFLFNLLVASGISAAAVPLFSELYRKNKKIAYQYMNSLMVFAVIAMLVVAVIIWLFAPFLSYTVAPGLSEEGRLLVVSLMRIVAVSPILFSASNALGAMLVVKRRFFWYGMSPLMYNAGIIGGAIFLSPHFGVQGVAYGAVAGAFLHMLVRLLDSLFVGWNLSAGVRWPEGFLKRTLVLMVPKMVGHPVELVTFWVFTSLASLLAPGSITILNLARNFQSVPVSLIGIAMATAVFSSLAEASEGSLDQLKELFNKTTRTILVISTLAALALFFLREPIVSLLLGGGAFDEAAVKRTAMMLAVFCLAVPTESLSHLFARAFYAKQNTVTPVIFSVISLVVSGTTAYALLASLGILAIPIGFFAGSLLKTLGLYLTFLRSLKVGK